MKALALCLTVLLLFGAACALAEEDSMTPDILPDPEPESEAAAFIFAPRENTTTQDTPSDTPQGSNPDKPWTYPIARALLDDPLDVLRVANQESVLEKDYPPSDAMHKLVDATVKKSKNEKMEVRDIVNDALVLMFADASDAGCTLVLHSAYRSYQTQATMYENRLKNNNGVDDGYVAKGGTSDHQTGLGVDVINPSWVGEKFNAEFAKTKEAQWMAENCAKYGFIIRYPQNKEAITKINYEPWHLRYVGREVAEYIMANGLTLEEFTAEWQNALAVYESEEPETDTGSGPIIDVIS